MADIEYCCRKCNTTRIFSEFADVTKRICSICGERLSKADDPLPATDVSASPVKDEGVTGGVPPLPGGGRLRLANPPQGSRNPDPQVQHKSGKAERKTASPSVAETILSTPLDLHPKVHNKKSGINHTLLAFLLFVLIGCAAGYLRYGIAFQLPGSQFLPAAMLAKIFPYFWVGILLLHIMVVLRAASDNMFQGMLCLFIPGWSIIYLLFISDNFYLRAVVFGCLIGIGLDGGVQIYEWGVSVMGRISEFINTGGGAVRQTPSH